jgi:hypothetical protein
MRIGPLIAALVMTAASPAARQDKKSPAAEVPPISWTCPMHHEIVEAEKGICPICKMKLEPVRLDSIWSCPVHAVVKETQPGKCPICRRDLGQVTVAVTWTCPNHPDIDQLERGKCPDGAAMVPRYKPRAHGNHNPLHGGLFFMAPDNWHHLEGTYPERGVFRLHLYNDYTKPLPPEKLKQARGRVVTQEVFDSGTRTTREISAFTLTPSSDGQYLEAKIDPLAPPAQMTAKVTLTPDGPEYRFDFAFTSLSREPVAGAGAAAAGVDPSLVLVEIPATLPETLAELGARHQQIAEIVQRGTFADLWVPALQAKDLALALDVYARDLPASGRKRAEAAARNLVLSAWRLDAYGDLGNREQITGAFAVFAAAVAELEAVFRTEAAGRLR